MKINIKIHLFNFLITILISLIYPKDVVFAHGGRTDASGCHNCRTGACAGTYHCHGGTTTVRPQVINVPVTQPAVVQPTNTNNYNSNTPVPQSNQTTESKNFSQENKNSESNFEFLPTTLVLMILGYFIYGIIKK
jgi:hypothetical protein